jgi:hypothetical protein
MVAIASGDRLYAALASGVLFVHAIFVLWVAAGAIFTRSRPLLRWVHIASLVWGLLVVVFPWSCPLTILENWLEEQAGVQPYQGGFLLHYLDALVYPNVSSTLLVAAGVAVCGFNLAVYARRYWKGKSGRAADHHW